MTDFRTQTRAEYKKLRNDGYRPSQALAIAKFEARYGKNSCKRDVLPSRYNAFEGKQRTDLPNGWYFTVEFKYDSISGPPEKECDGHGDTEWTTRSLEDWEREWVLIWDGRSKLVYDYKGALEKAKREGWNAPPYHEGDADMRARRAVKADYEYLRRYYNESWWYVGLIVTLYDADGNELDEQSCWGFESDCVDYLCEQARSWAAHMIVDERKRIRAETDAWRQFPLFREDHAGRNQSAAGC